MREAEYPEKLTPSQISRLAQILSEAEIINIREQSKDYRTIRVFYRAFVVTDIIPFKNQSRQIGPRGSIIDKVYYDDEWSIRMTVEFDPLRVKKY